jgi:hypothetical protein
MIKLLIDFNAVVMVAGDIMPTAENAITTVIGMRFLITVHF